MINDLYFFELYIIRKISYRQRSTEDVFYRYDQVFEYIASKIVFSESVNLDIDDITTSDVT